MPTMRARQCDSGHSPHCPLSYKGRPEGQWNHCQTCIQSNQTLISNRYLEYQFPDNQCLHHCISVRLGSPIDRSSAFFCLILAFSDYVLFIWVNLASLNVDFKLHLLEPLTKAVKRNKLEKNCIKLWSVTSFKLWRTESTLPPKFRILPRHTTAFMIILINWWKWGSLGV